MEYRGVRDAVFEAVDKASKEFGTGYALNGKRYAELGKMCELVGKAARVLSEEYELYTVRADVEMERKELIFEVVSDQLVVEGEMTPVFLELMFLADTVNFDKAGEDRLRTEIVVRGLWDKVEGD